MKRILVISIGIFFMTSIFLSACGKDDSTSADDSVPKDFSIGTSIITGTYYILAGPLSQLITDEIEGYTATHEATDGPANNLMLMENDEMYLAITSVLSAYQAFNGLGFAEELEEELVKSRALFMTHNSHFQNVTLKNMDIKTHRDLEGKIVDVTLPGSTPYIALSEFLDALDVTPKQIINSSLARSIDAMKDGRGHNGLAVTGYPMGALQDFTSSHDVVFIDFTKEEIDTILEKYPYYSPAILPANTYKGQTEDINTFQFWNMVVGHKDLPDDFVYELLTKVYDNVELFEEAHASAEIKHESILESLTPLHPGAVKYYEEKGIDIPENLIPPEMQ